MGGGEGGRVIGWRGEGREGDWVEERGEGVIGGKGEGREGDWVEERGGENDRVEREGRSDRVKSSVGGGA